MIHEMYGSQCMIVHKENKHHLCIRNDLFSCQKHHHNIHLKEKKQVLQFTNSKMLLVDGVLIVLKHSPTKTKFRA